MTRHGTIILAMLLVAGCGGRIPAPSTPPSSAASSGVASGPTPQPSVTSADPSPSASPVLPLADHDGWIAYNIGTSVRSTVRLVRPDGTDNHAIAEDAGPRSIHPDWMPDGRHLLFAQVRTPDDAASVWSWDMENGRSTELVSCTGSCLGRQNASPSVDGSQIVYETYDGPNDDVAVGPDVVPIPARCGLQVKTLTTGKTQDLVSGPCGLVEWVYPRFSPAGDLAYYRTHQDVRGGPITLTELVVRSKSDGKETVIDDWPDGGDMTQLDWSPDGQWIVFTKQRALQRIRSDGTGTETVVEAGDKAAQASPYHPRYLADGRSITFDWLTAPDGVVTSVRLYLIAADGGTATEVLPEGPSGTDRHYNWGSLQPTP
jgi:hypothetical protein